VFNMQGDLFLEEALGVTLDFTKARYSAEAGQSIKLIENAFLIDQLILKDKDGNTARVNGAITHTDLKDFTLDVTAQSSNFLFLDTDASDNPVFYGTAYAGGTIAFTGPVQDAFMSVVATSQPNTDIVIVAGGSSGTTEYSFIRFKEPPKETEEEDQKKEKGKSKLTMRFDLDVRPNANLKLQFEDEGYNTVSANGFGDLTINYDTEDLFEISGIYTINQGQYVVNLREVINEEFQLRPGGFVQWSGDPYEARINITADYRIPKADIRPLLASISTVNVGGTNVQAPATISIAINGSLDEPTIDYAVDVESGSLGSVGIDNVIRQINENKTELEQQVGLLLLAKRFGTLGSTPFEDGPFQDVAINTVSGLITKQFSSLLTEVGGLKNTTIDINYRNLNLQDGIDQTGLDQQIQLALTQEFLNNRVILQLGSDFNFGDQLNSGGQDNDAVTVGDIIFTYKIREDGRVLFRIFSRWDYDIIQSEDRRRNGFGFVFKKEFETFEELLRGKSQEQKDKEAAEKADRIRNREQNKIIKKQERQENRQKRRERKAAKKEEGVVPEEEN
ncbi:MAG: translocation/assembly module TamB domain-containing protein, partial [Saprospiraceae bacterium]|nr:translocation/assembly module TamB domain-containing protein [Saprospiraceae bacterium]